MNANLFIGCAGRQRFQFIRRVNGEPTFQPRPQILHFEGNHKGKFTRLCGKISPVNELIEARDLERHYRVGTHEVNALDGASFDVARGEFVAIVGPSGSGKSTLLALLGGLDRPTAGTISVGDLELGRARDAELVKYRRERIGFIFQSFNLLPTRSAIENVEIPLVLNGVKPRQRRTRALELLKLVGLAERADHRPNQLSGGEMQRVAVARALANEPLLIFGRRADGTIWTAKLALQFWHCCGETVAARGVTLIIVTHDLAVAAHADRIIHMRDGQVEKIEAGANI